MKLAGARLGGLGWPGLGRTNFLTRLVRSVDIGCIAVVGNAGGQVAGSLRSDQTRSVAGGGDGFASGFFYGLLTGEAPETALKLGWAHGALLTTFPGDTTMATQEQVRSLAQGGSSRIQR